jgi:AraC family transcriptional regulator of adaptative response/methylated-DNA-[protein]-cysteine methyltransferase
MLAAMRIVYHMANSPVGLLFVARTPRGLRHLEFMDRRSLKRCIAEHEAEHPGAEWVASLLELKPVVEQLESYFNGGLVEFEAPLDLAGSELELKVWKALLTIPFGETRTYRQIAAAVDQPRATRAVGLAIHENPLAIVVPCHRVIGADGSLTGYTGGVPKKRWLLDHEATHAKRLGLVAEPLAAASASSTRAGVRRAKR